ncbi:MAG: thiamine-monophosphate kinase [Pyrinomonadaceae bacterium]|jgi:thiamine-monophosphate kinase|nr:thiamine-monophosphate kinase [Pyrinomonadaceae bacterium]
MNEFDFIEKIRARVRAKHDSASALITRHSSLIQGIGDDAAVIRSQAGKDLVVTTDLLIEDIDFKRDTTSPELIGHKALAVSLSDVAAMGAGARWGFVSIGLPPDVWESGFAERLYDGYFSLAEQYGVELAGGDVSRTTEKIVIDSMLIGECDSGRAVLRRGAAAGDQIFVTGFLGDAAAGLRLLERGARVHTASGPKPLEEVSVNRLLLRQLCPDPRVGWGILLGEQQLASAMIDISDGLSSDLNHLCEESGVGAMIDASRIPIDKLVTEICGRRALDPLMLALHGGEDFELLFTVKPENVARLPRKVDGVSICQIGEVTSEPGKISVSEKDRVWDLKAEGFDHFKREG